MARRIRYRDGHRADFDYGCGDRAETAGLAQQPDQECGQANAHQNPLRGIRPGNGPHPAAGLVEEDQERQPHHARLVGDEIARHQARHLAHRFELREKEIGQCAHHQNSDGQREPATRAVIAEAIAHPVSRRHVAALHRGGPELGYEHVEYDDDGHHEAGGHDEAIAAAIGPARVAEQRVARVGRGVEGQEEYEDAELATGQKVVARRLVAPRPLGDLRHDQHADEIDDQGQHPEL